MKHISIIGFGRFGKTLYRILKDDFIITLYDKNEAVFKNAIFSKNTTITKNPRQIYDSDVIFFAVPISAFEEVIASHKKYFKKCHLLIDVLSVKLHPAKVFNKYLKNGAQALLTHPMFGPDSSKDGFEGLPIVLDKFKTNDNNYFFWKKYFLKKKLKVIEMSAREHDKMAANSQGLTHFIGRLLEAYHFLPTPIDSLGIKKLLQVKEQTQNDTWQLFMDLQHYNPHTKNMRLKLGAIYDKLYNKLLPEKITNDFITFGIQGGRGSFNEEALLNYLERVGIKKYKIKYLYTSGNVLRALHRGEVDMGQFAIHNSRGGIVEESVQAMARYKFKIIEQFAIKISHALMIRDDAEFSMADIVMAHPQVFAQCKNTLAKKYPNISQVSGPGKLVDSSAVAERLAKKQLKKNIATMGSKTLAKLYGLKIIEENLQDDKENYTSFLLVTRG